MIEQITIAIITILLSGLIGLIAARWQNRKAQADTASIYQQMALKETIERERLEAKFTAEIDVLKADRKALEERLASVLVELQALRLENKTWGAEKAELTAKLQEQQKEIDQLRRAIETLKKQTGRLGRGN